MLEILPGGICFAHGPYASKQCPEWPDCASDPQKQEYIDLSARQNKRYACLNAALELENSGILGNMVRTLRAVAEAYK